MNTRDFVVVPWGKPGNSVKLKYKHAHELQMEKIQLELETQEMQKKLQEFQSTWNKGKEEIKSSGYHWKSGNMGKLGNQSRIMSQNKGNAIKLSSGRVKLKLLKEQIQEPVKQPLNYKMASSFGSEGSRMRRKVCGQCENKAALLVCLECGEDYCSGCFAKMHQKGALKFHRTTLLQAKSRILSSVLDVAHQFIKEANPSQGGNTSTEESKKSQHKQKAEVLQGSNSEVEAAATERVDCANTGVRTLDERSLDEETPAQPFREAVSQWRAGHLEENGKQNLHEAKPDSVEECEVQTNLKIWTEPINIEFTEDSLTYMEKLWLKKHRRTPEDQLRSLLTGAFAHSRDTTSVTQCSQDETADSNVEEAKLKHPPLFMPVEKLNIERPQPSLTIVELDDTYEEEFGDPGTIVPYKVEIADGESQLSFTFPDYQKNYISCENDFYQHLVYNKGNTDLLNLCLKNSSTYCKDDLKGTSNTDFDNTVDSDISSYELKKIEESSSFERNVKEKNIDPGNDQKADDSCMPLGSKDSLSSTDSATPFIQENIFQNTTEFMNCSNPPESPNMIASKTTKSPLLLREIALRKKPVNERYKGTERSFTVDKSERLSFLPSANIACSHSCSTIAFADDRVWVPDSSLTEHAGDAGTLCDFQSDETSPPSAQLQKTGQKSQRPSTANFPFYKSTQKVSSCLSSPCSRSRSAAAQSQSRAASEISEIEYIDITDQNEPFLDNAADQQTLDSLEKELKVLRNLEDPSEKLHNLTSEELPAFNPHLMNLSEMPTDFLDSACVKGPYEAEELSTSGKDAKVQSLLLLGDYSTDEEEEDFLDKQHVLTLPWAKNV